MTRYVVAVDSGTTSCRALAFDSSGTVAATFQREFPQSFPRPGWVEHDPAEILRVQTDVLVSAIRAVGAQNVAAIGITNQRETTVVWDRKTRRPLHDAIVWQCRRTAPRCDELVRAGLEPFVREKTGLLLDAYFSATKMQWLREHVDGIRASTDRGDAVFGTIDSWLIANLTNGETIATEPSNASRTLLMDLKTRRWDSELLALFDIPEESLPEILPSDAHFGAFVVDGVSIPIRAVLGDQQAALYGQDCAAPGLAKCTYGTGCFLLAHAGETVPAPPAGMLSTVAWEKSGRVEYAIEGSVFVAGAVIGWLRDGLGILESSAESDAMARSVPDTGGVVFVPAFTGLGAPHWRPDARATISGLTRGTTRAHIVRAALEGIAHQVADVVESLSETLPILAMRVDGGASRNDFLMAFQADLLGFPIERSEHVEATAWGVARLAGESSGVWSKDDIFGNETATVFSPTIDSIGREALRAPWRSAIDSLTRG